MTRPHYEAQHYGQPSEISIEYRRNRKLPIWARILLVLLALGLLAGCLAGIGAALSAAGSTEHRGALTASSTGPGGKAVPAPPARTGKRLQPGDITISLKTTDKQCFGSAGCTVTVTPRLGWPTDQDPDGAYDVTYVITYKTTDYDGNGSRVSTEQTVGTARIVGDGDQYEAESHVLMTAERSTKISVKVDQVERRL